MNEVSFQRMKTCAGRTNRMDYRPSPRLVRMHVVDRLTVVVPSHFEQCDPAPNVAESGSGAVDLDVANGEAVGVVECRVDCAALVGGRDAESRAGRVGRESEGRERLQISKLAPTSAL